MLVIKAVSCIYKEFIFSSLNILMLSCEAQGRGRNEDAYDDSMVEHHTAHADSMVEHHTVYM